MSWIAGGRPEAEPCHGENQQGHGDNKHPRAEVQEGLLLILIHTTVTLSENAMSCPVEDGHEASRPGGSVRGEAERVNPVTLPLSPSHVHHTTPPRSPPPVFPNVDSLPASQRESSLDDGNGERGGRESRPDMRRHVVRPLVSVGEVGVSLGNVKIETSLQVVAGRGVGVFLDGETGRRMLDHHGAEPFS